MIATPELLVPDKKVLAPVGSVRRLGPAGPTDVMNMSYDQARFYYSQSRFNFAVAGRRSGKTGIGKRRGVKKATTWSGTPARFVFGAPTQDQANSIFWEDLKKMVPEVCLMKDPSEGRHTMWLRNGAIIQVAGFDRPQRAEGTPVAHVHLDEYADMEESVWGAHLRPMLTDTQGTADLTGVPEKRNHAWVKWNEAMADSTGEWTTHSWWTESVLHLYLGEEAAAREIASAKAELDDLTYRQEYQGEFVTFTGRVYYCFDRDDHCVKLAYNPNLDLVFCFDFNVEPGVAVICQEQNQMTCVIGEVYIPRNSNTPQVCRKLIADWKHHKRDVFVYGDPAGGARHTTGVQGNDYAIIQDILGNTGPFKGCLRNRVKRAHPPERVRINTVNSRLRTADGRIHMLVDPLRAPHVALDFENVTVKEGTDGEIDKDDLKTTHCTDAVGYYIEAKHPLKGINATYMGEQ